MQTRFIWILIVFILSVASTSCDLFRRSNIDNKEKAIQKEKKKRQKQDTILYQKALKQHMKNQSKETRKAMKQSMREAKRNREHKPEPFYLRWYKKWFREKPQQKDKG
ncbi:MAG: hypothetical protein N2Z72_02785 [Bacteroidales bacterium]|nr:hypothetical protein [Bacteroidales bacterium]